MKQEFAKRSNKVSLAVAAFILALAAPISAQQPPVQGAPADRTNTERERQQDMSRREWQLRNFGLEPKVADKQETIKALG